MSGWYSTVVVSLKSPIELEIQNLSSDPSSQDTNRITKGTDGKAITLALAKTVKSNPADLPVGSVKVESVELTTYSANLVTIQNNQYATVNLKAAVTIQFTPEPAEGTVEVQSANRTGQPTLKLNTTTSLTGVKVYSTRPNATANKPTTENSVDISLTVEEIWVTSSKTIKSVTATIPVKIEVKKTEEGERSAPKPVPITSVILKLPVPKTTEKNLTIAKPQYDLSKQTLTITVQATGESGSEATVHTLTGKGFYHIKPGYCIYSVRDGTGNKDIWAAGGGRCFYAACYYKKKDSSTTQALLMLYVLGNTLTTRYYGTQNNGTNWYEINEGLFIE